MFSQIADNSCLATIPRLTNSMTAWEDWQSQMPELEELASLVATAQEVN